MESTAGQGQMQHAPLWPTARFHRCCSAGGGVCVCVCVVWWWWGCRIGVAAATAAPTVRHHMRAFGLLPVPPFWHNAASSELQPARASPPRPSPSHKVKAFFY